MSQRGKITGGANRSFFRNNRTDILINKPADSFQCFRLDAGISLGKRMYFCDHHDPGKEGAD